MSRARSQQQRPRLELAGGVGRHPASRRHAAAAATPVSSPLSHVTPSPQRRPRSRLGRARRSRSSRRRARATSARQASRARSQQQRPRLEFAGGVGRHPASRRHAAAAATRVCSPLSHVTPSPQRRPRLRLGRARRGRSHRRTERASARGCSRRRPASSPPARSDICRENRRLRRAQRSHSGRGAPTTQPSSVSEMLPPRSHPPSLQPRAPVAVGALCEALPSVPWHVEYMRTPARRCRYDAKMRRASMPSPPTPNRHAGTPRTPTWSQRSHA